MSSSSNSSESSLFSGSFPSFSSFLFLKHFQSFPQSMHLAQRMFLAQRPKHPSTKRDNTMVAPVSNLISSRLLFFSKPRPPLMFSALIISVSERGLNKWLSPDNITTPTAVCIRPPPSLLPALATLNPTGGIGGVG